MTSDFQVEPAACASSMSHRCHFDNAGGRETGFCARGMRPAYHPDGEGVKRRRCTWSLAWGLWLALGCGRAVDALPLDASACSDSASGEDAGTGPEESSSDDGSRRSPDATPGTGDAGYVATEGGQRQTVCGPLLCNASSEVCCLQTGTADSPSSPACTPLDGCDGIPFLCSGPESCIEGDTCCTASDALTVVVGSECARSCVGGRVCTESSQCPPPEVCGMELSIGYGLCL